MIPENKQSPVKKALQTAFYTDAFEHIQPLTYPQGIKKVTVISTSISRNQFS
jgi:hypothetical protein